MKQKIGLIALALAVLASIVLVARQQPAAATGTPAIARSVFAGGGNTAAQGSYALTGVTGQVVAGKVSTGSVWLCTGILCGMPVYHVCVALVLYGYP